MMLPADGGGGEVKGGGGASSTTQQSKQLASMTLWLPTTISWQAGPTDHILPTPALSENRISP